LLAEQEKAMPDSMTICLPNDLSQAVADLAHKEGVSPDAVVGQAIKEHLFSRQFRLLRDRLAAKARAQGIVTDEDVFERVS
jgi:predicted transcriptional regulator